MYKYTELNAIIGLVFTKIERTDEELRLFARDGRVFQMNHDQDCCESVYIEDVVGDLDDLIGSTLVVAEERTEDDAQAYECGMWTFYEFATIKGSVTVRWYGTSNGYYAVGVNLHQVK